MSSDICFRICDASDPEQHQIWFDHWQSWDQREVFAHPDYVALDLRDGQRAICAIMANDNGKVLYPFIWRNLISEPYWQADLSRGADIITPYGYGGPFCWDVTNQDLLAEVFWKAFSEWSFQENIVSEFIRFSLFTDSQLPYFGNISARQQNIVRTLDISNEELWSDFKHKVRKNVKRAQENNIYIETDAQGNRLDEFLKIYYATMQRRNASDNYYFPKRYFECINQDLIGQFVYFHALYEGIVISTELVLVSNHQVYSFLGGTDQNYFHLRPNDLLKYQIILWAKRQGKRNFIIGGGYDDNDGIFQYKATFAPHGEKTFYIGSRILLPELYNQLIQNKRDFHISNTHHDPNFFPAYRA